MRILHYIFGMPPLRGGGAIRYAMDLASEQAKLGNDTALIYAGEISKKTEKVRIKRNRDYLNVQVFEILNPLPVPLVTGIKNPEPFMKKADKKIYDQFLEQENIEILHIHSLMGLHKEFLEAAKDRKIKILFTTHDYFGICPKTNLLYKGKICEDCQWIHCGECCAEAEDVETLIQRQSHWFQFFIKYNYLVKLKHFLWSLRKNSQADQVGEKDKERNICAVNQNDSYKMESYDKLRTYYRAEFELIDLVLYNSSVAKEQYEKRIKPNSSLIIGGMHKNIHDNRQLKEYGTEVRFAYLGYPTDYKGYYLLIEVLDKLDEKYHSQFVLNTYFEKEPKNRGYLRNYGPFSYEDLEKVYHNMDILIVPSLWAETYGLVALEALSYGVPVIMTCNVGASDLIKEHEGISFVIQPEAQELKETLEKIMTDRTVLAELNRTICRVSLDFNYQTYVKQILDIYAKY